MRKTSSAVYALVTCGMMCATGRAVSGEEIGGLRIRAAAAIAIQNAVARDGPGPSSGHAASPATPAASKPVVTMYTANWCVPCRRAKAELARATLPFSVREQDVSQGGQPEWCEALPAFAWVVDGQTRYVLGFSGVARLVSSWEQTLKK